jgi:hypothetical protein
MNGGIEDDQQDSLRPAVPEEEWLDGLRRHLQPAVVAASNAATHASLSSISIALTAWFKVATATRNLTVAGVAGSMIVFRRVVAVAEVPCWSRAAVRRNAAHRASR